MNDTENNPQQPEEENQPSGTGGGTTSDSPPADLSESDPPIIIGKTGNPGDTENP